MNLSVSWKIRGLTLGNYVSKFQSEISFIRLAISVQKFLVDCLLPVAKRNDFSDFLSKMTVG